MLSKLPRLVIGCDPAYRHFAVCAIDPRNPGATPTYWVCRDLVPNQRKRYPTYDSLTKVGRVFSDLAIGPDDVVVIEKVCGHRGFPGAKTKGLSPDLLRVQAVQRYFMAVCERAGAKVVLVGAKEVERFYGYTTCGTAGKFSRAVKKASVEVCCREFLDDPNDLHRGLCSGRFNDPTQAQCHDLADAYCTARWWLDSKCPNPGTPVEDPGPGIGAWLGTSHGLGNPPLDVDRG